MSGKKSPLYATYEPCIVCVSLPVGGPQRARLSIPPTTTLPSCLWSRRIILSLPGSRLMNCYCDASSALLQVVNQWLNSTYSRSHSFRYGNQNTNSGFHKNRTVSRLSFRTPTINNRCVLYCTVDYTWLVRLVIPPMRILIDHHSGDE